MFWQQKPTEKRKKRHRRRKHKSGVDDTLEKFVVEKIEIAEPGSVGPDAAHELKVRQRHQRSWTRHVAGWLGLWLLITASGMVARGIWPLDETRLLALAWDLWLRNQWLLPHLNGEVSLQPPLTAWLLVGGWKVLGVNEWWPRLLPALAGLLTLLFSMSLARRFWPDQTNVIRYVPWLMMGTGLWAIFLTQSTSDLVVTCLTSLVMLSLYKGGKHISLVMAPTLALDLLAGGPVILVYVLPVIILMPWWARKTPETAGNHSFGQAIFAVIIALGFWGFWLISASHSIGMYFWAALSASAGIVPQLFFYQQGAWWWYVYLIPIVFFPWSVWPMGWMRLWHVRGEKLNSGFIFCMIWGVAAVVILSFMTVRQPQLLLPIFPAYSLVLTWLLLQDDLRTQGEDSFFAGMTLPIIAIGGLLAVLPGLPRVSFLPEFLWEISPAVGVAVAAVGIGFAWLPSVDVSKRIASISVTAMFAVVIANFFIAYQFGERYQSTELLENLSEAERENYPIAQVGVYYGEYHFPARLSSPITVLNTQDVNSWIQSHPNGRLLTQDDSWQPLSRKTKPMLDTVYADRHIRVWDVASLPVLR